MWEADEDEDEDEAAAADEDEGGTKVVSGIPDFWLTCLQNCPPIEQVCSFSFLTILSLFAILICPGLGTARKEMLTILLY